MRGGLRAGPRRARVVAPRRVGSDPPSPPEAPAEQPSPSPTVAEFWETYLADARSRLARSTVESYEGDYRRRLEARFGDVRMSDIKPRAISQWRAAMLADGTGQESARRAMVLLQAMCTVAVEWGGRDKPPTIAMHRLTLRSLCMGATTQGYVEVDELWEPDPARGGPRRARVPVRIRAYVPARLADRSFSLSEQATTALSDAESAVVAAQAHADQVGVSTVAVQLMRSEAVASSQIEGVSTPGHRALARALVKADGEGRTMLPGPATATIANVRAVRFAYERAATASGPMTVEDLTRTHALVAQADRWLAQHAGQIRDVQNWIGRDPQTPAGADFVPPPARMLPELMEDLCAFCSREELSPMLRAAVAHAQFETLHPFADGNGRAGRVLIGEMLCRGGLARAVVPPTSLALSGQRERYVDELTAWRVAADGPDRWVTFLSEAVEAAARASQGLADDVARLKEEWHAMSAKRRSDSSARALIDHLPGTPVLSVETAAALLGKPYETARTAVASLEEDGVLAQVTLGRRNRAWECVGLFALVDDLERTLSAGVVTHRRDAVKGVPPTGRRTGMRDAETGVKGTLAPEAASPKPLDLRRVLVLWP